MKILIGCPISNRAWILNEYLECIYNLNYPKKDIILYWIVNNSIDDSFKILENFKRKHTIEYNKIIIEVFNDPIKMPYKDTRDKYIRRQYTYHWLALLRNKLLDKATEQECTFLLSSDSDILLRQDTLNRLLSHNVPLISSLIYNGYEYIPANAGISYNPIVEAYRYPNILKFGVVGSTATYRHVVNVYVKTPSKAKAGKTIIIDATGACVLLKNTIFNNRKIRYGYYMLGEDMAFCQSAISQGHAIICDLSTFNYHIMSKNLLELYKRGDLWITGY